MQEITLSEVPISDSKAEIIQFLLQKPDGTEMTIKTLAQQSEVQTLAAILSTDKMRKELMTKYDSVSFFRGVGPDIIFSGPGGKLKIEIKGSRLKHDYMNKGKYAGQKDVLLWGNSLKLKDFIDDGNLEANFVVLACCHAREGKEIKTDTKWDFLLFSNDQIQNLRAKSTTFMPTFCITAMVENEQSYFSDVFSGLNKGFVQLIKLDKTSVVDTTKVENDFKQVWEGINCKINCHLYQAENRQMVEHVWNKDFEVSWAALSHVETSPPNRGKFILKELIANPEYKCGFYALPTNEKDAENCKACMILLQTGTPNGDLESAIVRTVIDI